MVRWLAVVLMIFAANPAFAATVAVVDFERAVNETNEGKQAQERLDTMYSSRKSEVERMRDELKKLAEDYQSRALVLSDDARADAERVLVGKQQSFEKKYMAYQEEMQQTYYTLLSDLDEKMRSLTQTIAKEKGYDVVLDKAAVVYSGGETVDMTNDLIQRYNAR